MSLKELEQEEDRLRSEVTKLESEQRKYYYGIESKKIRDPDTYATLNYIIIGGLHHFYLGKHILGLLNLSLMIVGIWEFKDEGWLLVLIVLIVELPQLFRSNTIVKKYNNRVMANALEETKKHFVLKGPD